MAFLVLSVNSNSAFVWSTCNHLSQKTRLLFKIYTTGYEICTNHAEAAVLNSASTLPYSRAREKTQEEPTNTVIFYKALKILNGLP